jgi:predicted RNase H-like HicB family nuclease
MLEDQRRMKFTIAIETGTDRSAYGVAVPEFPGCFSAGESAEQAVENAREAIAAYCEIAAEEGKVLPAVRPMSEWIKDPQYAGWTFESVEVLLEAVRRS